MTSRVLSSTGTQRKTATDVATCKSALAALPVAPSFHPCVDHECGASLATTAGDTVKSYNDAAAVQALPEGPGDALTTRRPLELKQSEFTAVPTLAIVTPEATSAKAPPWTNSPPGLPSIST